MASNRIGVFLSQFIVRLFASNSFFFATKTGMHIIGFSQASFFSHWTFWNASFNCVASKECLWKQTLPCWRFGIVCNGSIQFSAFKRLWNWKEWGELRNASVFSFSGDWSCGARRRVFYALHKILRNDIHRRLFDMWNFMIKHRIFQLLWSMNQIPHGIFLMEQGFLLSFIQGVGRKEYSFSPFMALSDLSHRLMPKSIVWPISLFCKSDALQ